MFIYVLHALQLYQLKWRIGQDRIHISGIDKVFFKYLPDGTFKLTSVTKSALNM